MPLSHKVHFNLLDCILISMNRCRFHFEQIDPFGNYPTRPTTCWRPVDRRNRCIWHRNSRRKNVSQLAERRKESSESLQGSILRGCVIDSNLSFQACDLSEATFCGSSLQGTDFRDIIGIKTDFSGCNLSGADFQSAYVWGNFAGADLSEADLRGARFISCNFSGADLRGTRVDNAEIDGIFAGAKLPDNDILPDRPMPTNNKLMKQW